MTPEKKEEVRGVAVTGWYFVLGSALLIGEVATRYTGITGHIVAEAIDDAAKYVDAGHDHIVTSTRNNDNLSKFHNMLTVDERVKQNDKKDDKKPVVRATLLPRSSW